MKCKACKDEKNQIKSGKTRVGSQKYKCKNAETELEKVLKKDEKVDLLNICSCSNINALIK